MSKIIKPNSVLIEKIAGELAAVYYEVGRSQGLTSKCKNARSYAKKNLEKFIPKAVELCLQMLEPTSNCTEEMRMDIYEALIERHNDPELCKVLPNIDIKRVIEMQNMLERNKVIRIN